MTLVNQKDARMPLGSFKESLYNKMNESDMALLASIPMRGSKAESLRQMQKEFSPGRTMSHAKRALGIAMRLDNVRRVNAGKAQRTSPSEKILEDARRIASYKLATNIKSMSQEIESLELASQSNHDPRLKTTIGQTQEALDNMKKVHKFFDKKKICIALTELASH